MAISTSQLYAQAEQRAQQGNSPHERFINRWLADFELMDRITAIGGKNLSREAGLARSRLQEFSTFIEQQLQQARQRGGQLQEPELRYSGGQINEVRWGQGNGRMLTVNSANDLTDRFIRGAQEQTLGANTPSLLADQFQGMRRRNVVSVTDDAIQSLERRIQNESANIANILDLPANATPEQRQRAAEQAQTRQAALAPYLQNARDLNLGIEVEIAQIPSGWIPTEDLSSMARSQRAPQASGRPRTNIREGANGWEIVNSDTNNLIETVPFGDNRDVSRTQALARQQQITGGSTPSLAGRPDILAIEPTEAERTAGIEPIVPQTGMEAVEPRVATPAEIAAQQAGILPTPRAEITARDEALSNVDFEGATDEERAMIENLVDNVMGDTATITTPGEFTPEKVLELLLKPLSEQELAGFKATATSEVDPFYSQQFTRLREDFERSLEFKREEREAEKVRQEMEALIAREQTSSQMAERGLATSGIRQKAEERLAQQAQDVASSSRRRFEFDVGTLGRGAEDILGADNVPTSPLFTPTTGVRGSLEREQTTAIETRAKELEKQTRLRSLAAIPGIDAETLITLSQQL